jgi:CheY-like chemotaxis protein
MIPKPESAQGSRRRVLVVDDNADSAEMLGEWLKSAGYDTRTAHDGPGALAEAARFDPHFVLLDIGLPVMDGFEVARRLRQQAGERPTPVLVAITGYGQSMDKERTSQEGFIAHLIKPVDLKTIGNLLASS